MLAFQGKPAAATQMPKKMVACIGNSIISGVLLDNGETNAYPSVLQRFLGESCQVVNLGLRDLFI
jgi:lysophospholipase L1-like esterase